MSALTPATQLAILVLQLTLIIAAAQLFGAMAQKMGQSKVIGEIVAGIALGPSVLGMLSPPTYHFVFQSVPAQSMTLLGELGLVLLMFQIGLEFDLSHLKLRKNQTLSIAVALAGLALPFGLGAALGWYSRPYLAPDSAQLGYVLFVGVGLSVTAVPVLARILLDLNIAHLHCSRVAMLAAAMTDVLAWLILALVVALATSQADWGRFAWQLAGLAVYVSACRWAARPLLLALLSRLATGATQGAPAGPRPALALMLVAALLSSLATAALGFHSAFGALMMGLLLNGQRALLEQWRQHVGGFLSVVLMPVFFMLAGARADLGSMSSWQSAAWCGAFFVAAVGGKFGGCYAAARFGGMDRRQSRIVAILMNTRGLMELIVLTIGLDLGLITTATYSALVCMAVVTTLMTVPLVKYWMAPMLVADPARQDDAPAVARA
ncbi:MAG: cation:proton antiporter [Pseudomonadota bacterium]